MYYYVSISYIEWYVLMKPCEFQLHSKTEQWYCHMHLGGSADILQAKYKHRKLIKQASST